MHTNSKSLLGLGEEEGIKNEPAFYLVQGATVFQSVREFKCAISFHRHFRGQLEERFCCVLQ